MRGMLTRRELLSGIAAVGAGSALRGFSLQTEGPRIDVDRLRRNIEELSVYGRPAGGTFADGVSRIAYSDADVAGRKYVLGLMRAAGLEPRIDAAGNIFGRRAGSEAALKPILFGSHIDSVPDGGNFDGDLGSLSALEIMRTLKEGGIATRHPLEMVIWSNEEGGLVGSRAAAGNCPPTNSGASSTACGWRMGFAKSGAIPRGWPQRAFSPARSVAISNCILSRVGISTNPGFPSA